MHTESDPANPRGLERPPLDLDRIERIARARAAADANGVIAQHIAPMNDHEWPAALVALLLDDDALSAMTPAPLSGAMAGESIPELFDLEAGAEWPDDEALDLYETSYRETYTHTLEKEALDLLKDEARSWQSEVRESLWLEQQDIKRRLKAIDSLCGTEHGGIYTNASRQWLRSHGDHVIDQPAVDGWLDALDLLDRYYKRDLDLLELYYSEANRRD